MYILYINYYIYTQYPLYITDVIDNPCTNNTCSQRGGGRIFESNTIMVENKKIKKINNRIIIGFDER